MYTRKRRKHRGGSTTSGYWTRSKSSKSVGSLSRSSASFSHNQTKKGQVIGSKLSNGLSRELSLKGKLVISKPGGHTQRSSGSNHIKPIACRISLLQRMMLTSLTLNGPITAEQHNALKRMQEEILTQPDIRNFIRLNSSTPFFDFTKYDVYTTIRNIKEAVKGKEKEDEEILLPFVFFRENGTIPHYFILYYYKGKWYIYSSYGSDFVCICLQKIGVSLYDFIRFMKKMDIPVDIRTDTDKDFIRSFMKKKFLANPTQQRSRTENKSGNTVTFFCNIKKGVQIETEGYVTEHIRVEYVPNFADAVKKAMKEIYLDDFKKMGLSRIDEDVPNTSSGASASAASATPGHTMNN